MDDHWLQNLTQSKAVIVPTRSLANTLKEQIANFHIAAGRSVWEAPNILLWQDYLRILWQHNRGCVSQLSSAYSIVSARQSALLWTQVIESSKRQEQALTLLDVQQTVRAVQRSWRLMNDWCVEPNALRDEHVADTAQFLRWIEDYRALLVKRHLMDEGQLQQLLLEAQAASPFTEITWYCYDLITTAQQQLNQLAEQAGCLQRYLGAQPVDVSAPSGNRYLVYSNSQDELHATLSAARLLLEANREHTVNIVIPDLQVRHAAVEEAARNVFYPGLSPLQVQLEPTIYRFSLGQPLQQWPAIETALSLLKLLNNRATVTDLSFLLRNQFLKISRQHAEECRLFERWLLRQRIRQVSIDRLPELYLQCLDFLTLRQQQPESQQLLPILQALVDERQALAEKLSAEKHNNGYAALSFADWLGVFDQWLNLWGWHTGVAEDSLNSVQFQLHARWSSLLEEFAGLALVQKQVGLARALELLRQMSKESIFQPQAVASPILISGVFEAIGRPVDHCFLLSVDQAYPAQPQPDAFVPNSFLRKNGYPNASAEASFQQAQQVTASLLSSAKSSVLSFAMQHDRDPEIENVVSPLFRNDFRQHAQHVLLAESASSKLCADADGLHQYTDLQGPSWPLSKSASGGTQIFQNQSLCAFRGFVTHRLGFLRSDEAEFGLDSLDRGNIVHILLDVVWAELQTQDRLREYDDDALSIYLTELVERVCSDPDLELAEDKKLLLRFEQPRLRDLLKRWLDLEKRRPTSFSVVEREESRTGEIGGITFDYIVDRLDLTEDGRSVIIDYKTGAANRNDWLGERIRSPQMPLYALCHDKVKRQPVAGISFAKVQQIKPEFVELCEADILRSSNATISKREDIWHQQRALWPELFESLADEFLKGKAQVNPIDERTCDYCELQAMCRVSELRVRSATPTQDSPSGALDD